MIRSFHGEVCLDPDAVLAALSNHKAACALAATQAEAIQLLRKLGGRAAEGQLLTTSTPTVSTYLDERFATNRDSWRPSTRRSYRGAIDLYLVPAFGPLRLEQLSPRHVQKWLTEDKVTAIATLIAAVVAAGTAVTVAFVNTRAARRLEKDKAHRAYREEAAKPLLTFSRKVVRHTGELEGELASLRRSNKPLKESLAPWIRKLSEISDDTGPMYGADEGMIESSRLILEAIVCAGVILSVADSKSRDLCLDLLSRSSFATKSACASLELQAEAYVYDGSRRNAKRRMKQARDAIETLREEIRAHSGYRLER